MQAAKAELYELLAGCTFDPLAYTLACFPWGEGELAESKGPRKWQTDMLQAIGEHINNPLTRYVPLRIAVAAGHGIGKSALVAFVSKWAMGTCEDAKVVITANTGTQLSSKTSPELAKWYRLALDAEVWDVKATSITCKEPGSEKTWRTDLIPWSENNAEAFSGLHNLGRIILLVFDEASGIADIIWDTAQGALTDEKTIIIWLAFGNPTLNTGRFRECFGSQANLWIRRQIDSRTVEGTNKQEIARWAESRGEDSDFFRVRVRGEFPLKGNSQFIAGNVVYEARHYVAEGYETIPKILACDVARFGEDRTIIGLRQGRKFEILEEFSEKPTNYTGERVINWIERLRPFGAVVDETGVGAGVVDYIRARGYAVLGFNGGAASFRPGFYNRRADVYDLTKTWLECGAEIPDDPELAEDLTSITFDYAKGKTLHGTVILESKDEMKKRGLRSPDKGDTLAMTHAVTVAIGEQTRPEEEDWVEKVLNSGMGIGADRDGWMR